MSTTPKLTIGVPTFNRPHRVKRAIASALWQSLPARVIVADDGDNDDTELACRAYKDNPNFSYRRSPARTLWQNWKWVAEAAADEGAEYFCWLQDDDLLAPHHARRVCGSFAEHEDALLYQARVLSCYESMLGCGWVGHFGPRVPQDHLFQQPATFPGTLLVPIGYCDSWSIAPATTFRVGEAFRAMLDWLPEGADGFRECLDGAFMGAHGPVIADPVTAGYWVIHDGNESRLTTAKMPEQRIIAYAKLDELMDRLPDWRVDVMSWMSAIRTTEDLPRLLGNLHPELSRHAAAVGELLQHILDHAV